MGERLICLVQLKFLQRKSFQISLADRALVIFSNFFVLPNYEVVHSFYGLQKRRVGELHVLGQFLVKLLVKF